MTLFRQVSVPVVPLKLTRQITEIRKVEFMHWISKIDFDEVHSLTFGKYIREPAIGFSRRPNLANGSLVTQVCFDIMGNVSKYPCTFLSLLLTSPARAGKSLREGPHAV